MTRDQLLYLTDIAGNMRAASDFVQGMSFEEFAVDRRTAYAVVRCLEIVGEASKNVPPDMRARRPAMPWSDMARMRDKCIHMYWGIKYAVVWTAVKEEIPQLLSEVESLIAELRG